MNLKKYIILLLLFFTVINLSAQSKIDSLENVLDKKIPDSVRLEVLLDLSKQYNRIDFEKSLAYSMELLELSKRTNNKEKIAHAYNVIATNYIQLGYRFDTIIKTYQSSITIANEINNIELKGRVLNNIGIAYRKAGKTNEAIKAHQTAFEIAEETKSKRLAIFSLNSLANIFKENNQIELAKVYYLKGLKYAEASNDTKNIAYLNSNLATLYHMQNRLDSALVIYNKALETNRSINDGYAVSTILSNIGSLYIEKKAYEKAFIVLEESYQIAVDLKNSYTMGLALSGLAHIYYEQGKYQAAIKAAEAALAAFGEDGTIILRLNCYEYLSKSHEKLQNYKLALENQKVFNMFSDSLFNIEKNKQISDLKVQYEVKEKETENELLKAEKQHNQKIIRQQTYAAVGLILALFFAIVLIVSNQRSNQKKQQLNEALRKKNEQLKGIDKAKTQFFANLSHELKTPLILILNPLQKVLKNKRLKQEERYLVKLAEKSSLQLFDLIYQILELTKFEDKKVLLNPTTINLKRTIDKLYLDFESLAQNKKINFQLEYEANEALIIEIDEYKFTTVIKNLISNALKFTSENGLVKLKIEEQVENLTVSISDTGRGIYLQDLPHVFDRYYQGKISGDIMEGGTGIGLAICKEYIDLMDGKINVKSTLGKGSIFIIELPKVVSESAVYEIELEENLTKAIPLSTINQSENETMPTVLVVEDNINMQEYLTYILNDYYNVIIAQNGKAALEILNNRETVDLVITDLMMPEMNGHELVTIMKSTPQFAGIPIIMLTALSGTDEKLKALRIGIDDYILKPFVDEELLARIDNLISNAEERQLYRNISETDEVRSEILDKDTEISKEDMEWLTKFEEIVAENYRDFHFTIDTYTEDLMMSRTKIYRKIKVLTGLTPKRYINEVRFRAARKMLENKEISTIKALAYEVGFRNQKYFSSSFKKRFGKSPSEYLQ